MWRGEHTVTPRCGAREAGEVVAQPATLRPKTKMPLSPVPLLPLVPGVADLHRAVVGNRPSLSSSPAGSLSRSRLDNVCRYRLLRGL
jgi:hypothetical protein